MATTKAPTLDFDPDSLRDRYREERDKRRRADGNQQYVNVVGELSHYLTDPYVEHDDDREPLTDEVEIVIVGGGFGGLLAGARLREAGFDDIRLIEKGGDVGGTWYWNRYPGAMCDVESYVYLPLLEEMEAVPSEKYAKAPEILEHSQNIARHFDLYRNSCFGTEVTDATWDDDAERWIISTNRGDRMRARYLIMSNGPLHRPKLPGIPGVTSFAGHSFHTSRWDYDYTGGDPTGGLTGLADKRVAIIGTGATAVQCIPHLGAGAKELFVFQRTPSSIDVRNNRPTAPDWVESLEPGWQKNRMDNFNTLVSGGFAAEDLVNDGWTDIIGKLLFRVSNDADADLSPEGLAATMELADFEKMNQIRARVDEIVEDVSTAQALKPWYRQFCKRPCFHDEYLDTYNRANVTLVDTRGQGVDAINERGVVFDGVEYEVDCIVYATGFEVGTDYTRRSGYELTGRDGLTLTEKWADGVSTFHGLFSRGFPNCFIMGHLQSAFTVNYPHLLNEQSQHLGHVLRTAIDAGTPIIEAEQSAEDEWVETIIGLARNAQDFLEECTPGYYNNEGRPAELSGRNGSYGGGSIAFFQLLADWRAEGAMAGLECRPLDSD